MFVSFISISISSLVHSTGRGKVFKWWTTCSFSRMICLACESSLIWVFLSHRIIYSSSFFVLETTSSTSRRPLGLRQHRITCMKLELDAPLGHRILYFILYSRSLCSLQYIFIHVHLTRGRVESSILTPLLLHVYSQSSKLFALTAGSFRLLLTSILFTEFCISQWVTHLSVFELNSLLIYFRYYVTGLVWFCFSNFFT